MGHKHTIKDTENLIKKLFPQLRNFDLQITQPKGYERYQYCIQQSVNGEVFGNEYKVDVHNKTLKN